MKGAADNRIAGVLLVCLGAIGALLIRCVWLQVLDRETYHSYALSQYSHSELMRAHRGTIYDRKGRPLAASVLAPSIYANARRMRAKQDVAERLAPVLGVDKGNIKRRLEKDKGFVWLARQIDWERATELKAMDISNLGIMEELRRIYPNGVLASHILGFVNVDNRGLEGIELAYDGILTGQDGWMWTVRDARGRQLFGPWTQEVDPIPGYDVVLTIDSVIQQVVDETLQWGVEKFHAKGGSITVMDPYSGAILAMSNWPVYDPNKPAESGMESRRNRALTDLFEPGSTFKIVTASALLEEGRITPEDPIFCENGEYPTVGRHVLHDHSSYGEMPFRDVIKYSSNIGVAKAAQRLTPQELYDYIRAFGFGDKTGIDFPGEVSGIFREPDKWSKLSPFIIPIGHEVSVTPIQLAVMVSVIANGGLRVKPYLVERVQAADGTVIRSHPRSEYTRVISRETAGIVQDLMVGVVASGTGRRAQVKGLTVAGKTGTAQKIESNGQYSHSRFVASFVGFVPVPDARLVIVVNMDEPRPIVYGGSVSAPMFKRVVERLSSYALSDEAREDGFAGSTDESAEKHANLKWGSAWVN